jgi:hypothetical protein
MWVSFDIFMMAVWLIVTACNRQGFICCLLLVYYIFFLHVAPSNFHLFLFVSVAHFLASASNIELLSTIRKVLFIQGCIFYIAAVDKMLFYNFDSISNFKEIRPYAITALDFYIIFILTRGRIDGLRCLLANWVRHGLLCAQTYVTHYKGRK